MRYLRALLVAAVVIAGLPFAVARATAPAEIDPFLSAELSKGGEVVAIVNASSYDAAKSAIENVGLDVKMSFERVDAAVTVGHADQIKALASQPGVLFVEGNRPLDTSMETAVQATRVDVAEEEFSARHGGATLDGSGIGVAIVDSGLAGDHPMFADRVVRNFKSLCAFSICDARSDVGPTGDTDSPVGGGHGTHVAGIASGAKVQTSTGMDVRGVATGSSIYSFGSGAVLFILDSATSLNWILANHAAPCADMDAQPATCPPIKVVNNSYTSSAKYNENGLMEKLSDGIVREGVVMVWAAGNSGGDGTNSTTNGAGSSPVPGVLMVANYDDADSGSRDGALDSTSSRGKQGDPTTYPDLSAPGSAITSACKPTLVVCHSHANFDSGDLYYGTISGTSMAAPLVAGAVALLLQAYPELTPGQIEEVFEDTAYKFGDASSYEDDPRNAGTDTTSFDKGHGLLDVAAALRQLDGVTVVDDTGSCAATVLTDEVGDAAVLTGIGPTVGEGAPTPDVDVVSLSAPLADGSVEFTIGVADLDATPHSAGDAVRSFFNVGAQAYILDMRRDLSGATTAVLSVPDPADSTGIQTIVVGRYPATFDATTDLAWAELPSSVLKVAAGDQLTGIRVLWRRSGQAVALPADELSSGCPLVIG